MTPYLIRVIKNVEMIGKVALSARQSGTNCKVCVNLIELETADTALFIIEVCVQP